MDKKNIRVIFNFTINNKDKRHNSNFNSKHYKNSNINNIGRKIRVIKVLLFWATIKSFNEDDYADACDCFRYCTNPYKY